MTHVGDVVDTDRKCHLQLIKPTSLIGLSGCLTLWNLFLLYYIACLACYGEINILLLHSWTRNISIGKYTMSHL